MGGGGMGGQVLVPRLSLRFCCCNHCLSPSATAFVVVLLSTHIHPGGVPIVYRTLIYPVANHLRLRIRPITSRRAAFDDSICSKVGL